MKTVSNYTKPAASSWWIVAILWAVYTVIYLPSVFTQIEAREFMGIDPASIMASLDGLTHPPYYNMNRQYHSQYYGWTYFSLNFFVLMAAKPFGFTSVLATNVIVRIVLFVIGAALVGMAYLVAQRLFSTVWSAIIVLALLADPISAHYFTEIHPESLGQLLQIVAIKFLLDVYQGGDFRRGSFFWAVTFLSLSALCKQSFFVANVFIYIGFFIIFSKCSPFGKSFMTLKIFSRLTFSGIGRFFVVLMLIHPFAVLDMRSFIIAQVALRSSASTIGLKEAVPIWYGQIIDNPIILINFLLLAASPFLSKKFLPFIVSLTFTAIVNIILMLNQSNFILSWYLYPTQVFMFFNVFYFATAMAFPKMQRLFSASLARILRQALTAVMILNLISNLSYATYQTHSLFLLDGLDTQRVAWFALRDLPVGTKIAYSPNVAILSPLKETGCHAWQGCAGVAELTTFDPDYVVFSPNYNFFDADDYTKFVRLNNYVLERTITATVSVSAAQCKPNFGESVGSGNMLLDVGTFFFLNPVACLRAYQSVLMALETGSVERGDPIMIYKRSF